MSHSDELTAAILNRLTTAIDPKTRAVGSRRLASGQDRIQQGLTDEPMCRSQVTHAAAIGTVNHKELETFLARGLTRR